jgi:hypothetical protein
MTTPDRNSPYRTAFVVLAPLALAILELFHPQPHDLFALDLDVWLAVHYLQIALFPLAALSLVVLVSDLGGFAAGLSRLAMFIFAVSYTAFDTAAGVVTGVLVKGAKATGAPETWRPAINEIWMHPIMGGAPGTAPLLAVSGAVAWSIGAVAAAVAIRRAGYSWVPIAFLVISAFGLSVFRTHAWPGGPLTFGALAVAAAWVQWERGRKRVSVGQAT